MHPNEGFIPPDQFISLAEQTGLITPLTHWVLNEAVRQSARWRAAGLDIEIAVNLSALNLEERDLVDAVTTALERWKVPASVLCLEMTESALMRDPARAMATLTLLHDLGVHISIDDFGTGYSSLAYLKRLPVDQVKIDRSFVLEMIQSEESCAIVRSVIDLGHNLNLQVVAEGVETQRELDALALLGCDIAQGYYLGRPMPAAEYPGWLGEWRQSVITECA
jgi:EAL domain-containing protein (putative c-di-GMP-specific phosphodiesterase class I)